MRREHSLLGVALVAYLFIVIVTTLYSVEWMGLRAGPLFMVGLACAFPAFYSLRARTFDPLEPVWLYTAIFFLEFFVKPMLTLHDPHRFGFAMIPMDYFAMPVGRSLIIAFAGLVAFYFGYYRTISSRRLPVLILSDDWNRARQVILFVCGLGAFAYSVNFFLSRAGYSVVYIYLNRAVVGGFSSELAFFVQVFGWIAAIIVYRRCLENGGAIRWGAFILLLTALVLGFSIFGSRWTLMFIPVSVMIIRHYVVARISGASLAAVFSALFVFSAAFGAYRGTFDLERASPSAVLSNLADEVTAFADWDIFLAISDYYPEYRRHYSGRLAAEAVLWVIPRSIWPGKPVVYGPSRVQDDIAPNLRVINVEGGYSGTAISQSTLGEGYADFGIVGAIAYMGVFGLIWGWVYTFLRRNLFSYSAAALYSLLYISLPLYVRGFAGALVIMALWGCLVSLLIAFMGGVVRVRWS